MIKINTAIIRGLNPCESRFNNYLNHYKDFNGTLEEFLALANITYSDKTWVFKGLASKTQLLRWSYLCAESVLHIFETKYPNDKRPRQALDAKLKYINEPTEDNLVNLNDRRNAAATSAANATNAANADAANAANAAVTANAANAANADAANAANAAVTANAANAAVTANDANATASADYADYAAAAAANAADTCAAAAAARKAQQDLNLLFMIEAVY
jgi:hypothetical protein